jgi:hypothetical protein
MAATVAPVDGGLLCKVMQVPFPFGSSMVCRSSLVGPATTAFTGVVPLFEGVIVGFPLPSFDGVALSG